MGRNIVVTGGATGIGRAIASVFAAAGDTVVITGRRREPLRATAAELGVTAHTCDATDPAQIEALVDQLPRDIDVLVNNAGGNTDFDRAAPTDLASLAAAWRANLDANLISAVLMTSALRDRLNTGGSVVNIGSIAADKGAGAYGAAKAGLASWNAQLSAELGPRGITANVVSPGYIAATEFFRDKLTDERRDSLIAATHTRRPGVPEDVAAAVHYLASPAARQVTGQVLAVNGGEHTTR
ncbi:SDR family NAD(P)-dependent oxidoreductase [Nocardia brasiliensis]|uniref:SDR family NAD(P)-dependent oxidoreductase n=1 Tax=Nocardia brasiliensis TaxID=37326 RepID=UPI00367280CA